MLDVTSPDARTRAFAFGGTRAGIATRFVASIVLLQLSGVIVNGTVYPELAGFGQLRAEDILAAELLGSGRSIGRQDKAAAAAVFDRYAILF